MHKRSSKHFNLQWNKNNFTSSPQNSSDEYIVPKPRFHKIGNQIKILSKFIKYLLYTYYLHVFCVCLQWRKRNGQTGLNHINSSIINSTTCDHAIVLSSTENNLPPFTFNLAWNNSVYKRLRQAAVHVDKQTVSFTLRLI